MSATAIPDVVYEQHGVKIRLVLRPDRCHATMAYLTGEDWAGRLWQATATLDTDMCGQRQAALIEAVANSLKKTMGRA